jgi:hypothetical protein
MILTCYSITKILSERNFFKQKYNSGWAYRIQLGNVNKISVFHYGNYYCELSTQAFNTLGGNICGCKNCLYALNRTELNTS